MLCDSAEGHHWTLVLAPLNRPKPQVFLKIRGAEWQRGWGPFRQRSARLSATATSPSWSPATSSTSASPNVPRPGGRHSSNWTPDGGDLHSGVGGENTSRRRRRRSGPGRCVRSGLRRRRSADVRPPPSYPCPRAGTGGPGVRDRPPELSTLARVLQRVVQGPLGDPDRRRRDRHARVVQSSHRSREAGVLRADEPVTRDADVVEIHLAGGRAVDSALDAVQPRTPPPCARHASSSTPRPIRHRARAGSRRTSRCPRRPARGTSSAE
jgi:hypothetical protein